MKLAIKLPSTNLDLQWPFQSISTVLPIRTQPIRGKNAGDAVIGVRPRPARAVNLCGPREDKNCFLREHNNPVRCRQSPPSITPLYHGRNRFVQPRSRQERCSTPMPPVPRTFNTRCDRRRYGVYLPHYDVALHSSGHTERIATHSGSSQIEATCARRVRTQRSYQTIPTTYRAEDEHNIDRPPEYSALDPHPIPQDTGCRHDTRRRVSASLAKGLGNVSKMAKDLPGTMKDAQARVKVMRAQGKIRWLQRHDFLSGQDRLLRPDLSG